MFPTGQATAGSSSTLNLEGPGETIANASIGTVGNGGRISLYTSTSAHLIADVFGFFTGAGFSPPADTDPLLSDLTIAPQNASVPDNRNEWQHWIDADGDFLDTRAEVLIQESRAPLTYSTTGCSILSGTWVDPWAGSSWTAASDVDIDHHVALQNAHVSGGWAWDTATKRSYANDLDDPKHLNAMDDALNSAKGSSRPDQWRPPLQSSWCQYAEVWASVKIRWQLTVTQIEHNALRDMLATC